jgi:transposase
MRAAKLIWRCIGCVFGHLVHEFLDTLAACGQNTRDMPRRHPSQEDAKAAALRAAGALHPRPEVVQDEAFVRHEFFDRRDRVQVKYEMVRRHRVDGRRVTDVAGAFGVSRQAFYTADAAFSARGIPGLLPRPRGPQRAHKCTDEILDFVAGWRAEHETPAEASLVAAVQQRFGMRIHPRSLTRALARREKKRRGPRATS